MSERQRPTMPEFLHGIGRVAREGTSDDNRSVRAIWMLALAMWIVALVLVFWPLPTPTYLPQSAECGSVFGSDTGWGICESMKNDRMITALGLAAVGLIVGLGGSRRLSSRSLQLRHADNRLPESSQAAPVALAQSALRRPDTGRSMSPVCYGLRMVCAVFLCACIVVVAVLALFSLPSSEVAWNPGVAFLQGVYLAGLISPLTFVVSFLTGVLAWRWATRQVAR